MQIVFNSLHKLVLATLQPLLTSSRSTVLQLRDYCLFEKLKPLLVFDRQFANEPIPVHSTVLLNQSSKKR